MTKKQVAIIEGETYRGRVVVFDAFVERDRAHAAIDVAFDQVDKIKQEIVEQGAHAVVDEVMLTPHSLVISYKRVIPDEMIKTAGIGGRD